MAAISLVAGGWWQLSPWIHTLQCSGPGASKLLATLARWLSGPIGSLALRLIGIATPCSVVALWTVDDGHLWTVQEQGRADYRDEQ